MQQRKYGSKTPELAAKFSWKPVAVADVLAMQRITQLVLVVAPYGMLSGPRPS